MNFILLIYDKKRLGKISSDVFLLVREWQLLFWKRY